MNELIIPKPDILVQIATDCAIIKTKQEELSKDFIEIKRSFHENDEIINDPKTGIVVEIEKMKKRNSLTDKLLWFVFSSIFVAILSILITACAFLA